MIRYSRACGSYQDFIKRVDANKEATVPRVPFGKVEVIEHFTVATMTGQKKKYKRTNNDLQNIYIKLKIE
jgi:hypothetical protein